MDDTKTRCGFTFEPEDTDINWESDIDEWYRETGTVCCWRPVWEQRETDHCIWHADIEGKSSEALEDTRAKESEKLDGAILRKIKLEDEFSFSDCGLLGADFTDADLRNVDFSGADLRIANLSSSDPSQDSSDQDILEIFASKINLGGADFSKANLLNADLSGANLSDADFSNAYLRGVDFSNANLARANLPQSLWDTDFTDASLSKTNIPENIDSADLSGANLTRANLSGKDLWGADLSETTLTNADLSGANLTDADFTRAHLLDADLSEANLSEATFVEANLWNSDISQAELSDADFSDADLPHVDLSGANLRGGTLSGTQLSYSVLNNTRLFSADLSDANLSGANLTAADLREVDLEEANLEDAMLIQADIRDANLRNTRLYQVHFSDTRMNNSTEFDNNCVYEAQDVEPDIEEEVSNLEAAAWVYRRLELLHEENAMSGETRRFHVRKEEAQRKVQRRKTRSAHWSDRAKYENYASYMVASINRWVTYHGESLAHITGWSVTVILLCGILYPFVGGIMDDGQIYSFVLNSTSSTPIATLARGLYFSTITFTTIGYANVAPIGAGSRVLVGFESLSGALLIALFVFVLGRRVAR